jgi:hypothetical protein
VETAKLQIFTQRAKEFRGIYDAVKVEKKCSFASHKNKEARQTRCGRLFMFFAQVQKETLLA